MTCSKCGSPKTISWNGWEMWYHEIKGDKNSPLMCNNCYRKKRYVPKTLCTSDMCKRQREWVWRNYGQYTYTEKFEFLKLCIYCKTFVPKDVKMCGCCHHKRFKIKVRAWIVERALSIKLLTTQQGQQQNDCPR